MAIVTSSRRFSRIAGLVVGWAWALLAGGGGIMLLFEKGPLPLTNGWFALASGISAWPVLPWAAQRVFGIRITALGQFIAAVVFFVAGHLALFLEHRM